MIPDAYLPTWWGGPRVVETPVLAPEVGSWKVKSAARPVSVSPTISRVPCGTPESRQKLFTLNTCTGGVAFDWLQFLWVGPWGIAPGNRVVGTVHITLMTGPGTCLCSRRVCWP